MIVTSAGMVVQVPMQARMCIPFFGSINSGPPIPGNSWNSVPSIPFWPDSFFVFLQSQVYVSGTEFCSIPFLQFPAVPGVQWNQ